MDEDLERLKQRLPLLEAAAALDRSPRRPRQEWVGLCPLHRERRPSFYVNTRKNLFYCHGCGQGGDLIRLVELSLRLSFRQSVAHLKRQLVAAGDAELLEHTAAFYRSELDRHSEAAEYLVSRGLREPGLIEELGLGYGAAAVSIAIWLDSAMASSRCCGPA